MELDNGIIRGMRFPHSVASRELLRTDHHEHLEQARQTILAGAQEVFLFCYGALQSQGGRANVEALRDELPDLFALARWVRGKTIRGIDAPKPPNSEGGRDKYVFDYIGMLGLPLKPTASIDLGAESMFLSEHALRDPQLVDKLRRLSSKGTPVLITNNLAQRLPAGLLADLKHVSVIDVPDEKRELMEISEDQLHAVRNAALTPMNLQFKAPARTALYLFAPDLVAVENFNDRTVRAELRFTGNPTAKAVLSLPEGDSSMSAAGDSIEVKLAPRGLVVLRVRHSLFPQSK